MESRHTKESDPFISGDPFTRNFFHIHKDFCKYVLKNHVGFRVWKFAVDSPSNPILLKISVVLL